MTSVTEPLIHRYPEFIFSDGGWAVNENGYIGRVRYRAASGRYIGDRVDGSRWESVEPRRINDKDIAILLQEHKIHQNPEEYL